MKMKFKSAKSIVADYKDKSLLVRNYITLLSFALVLIFLFSIYIFNITKEKIDNEYIQTTVKDAQKISVLTDSTLNDLFLIAPQIATNDSFKLMLFSNNAKDIWSESTSNSVKELTDAYPYLHSYVHSVELYFESSEQRYSTDNTGTGFTQKKADWYNEYKTMKPTDTKIVFRKYNGIYPYLITYIYKCSYFGYSGAIAVNVDIRKLEKIIDKSLSENQICYILKGDEIIYKKNTDSFMEKATEEKQLLPFISEEPGKIKTVDSKKYTFHRIKSDCFGWDYFLIDEISEYDEKMNIESYLFKIMLFLAFFFVLGIAFIITVNTYRPVSDLVKFVDETTKRDLSSLSGKEIRYIAKKISEMINENSELKKELDRYIVSLNETQMTALKTQINPHFLFNTLNIINLRLSEAYGIDYKGEEMLENLSSILRYTFSVQENTVSVKDEIDNAKKYTKILSERYNHSFKVIFDIEEKLDGYKIPILTFQPLIENAVYHGIGKNSDKENTIMLTGKITDEYVVFAVSDNGKGMSVEKLAETKKLINRTETVFSSHIGLTNINRRIKLLYGEKYGVNISSQLGKGTTVTLIFPKQ